jgi:hypothetical protein
VTRRGAAVAFGWCGAVWFSVVYLGQHYVTDVIGGIVFAVVTWLVMMRWVVPRVASLQHKPAAAAAGAGPGVSEPSSIDLDTAEPAGTQEPATSLRSGSDR